MVKSMRNAKESSLRVLIAAVLSISLGAMGNGINFQNSLFASTDGGDTGDGNGGSGGSGGNGGGNEGNDNGGDNNNDDETPDEPEPEPNPTPDEPVPASTPEPEPVAPLPEEPVPPTEPLPYCDTPEGEAATSCHDRYDYDEETGLYPCNDGRQVTDPLDCKAPSEEPCPAFPAADSDFPPGCPGPSPCKGADSGTSGIAAQTLVCPLPPPREQPDRDCMFNPDLPKCAPDEDGNCPPGFGKNDDGQCFPFHYGGCPSGYHSHEDDESGRCIPDKIPCEPGYMIAPNYPECQKKGPICEKYPDYKLCKPGNGDDDDDNNDGNDNDITTIIRNEINNIKKIVTIVKNDPSAFEVDLVAMGINSDGTAMKCLMDVDRKEVNCEEFRVPENGITGSFKVFVEFESGAKDRAAQDSYLKSLKDNINDIDFIEDNVDNKDLGVDIAATGINPGRQGLECIINTDKETAECEEFNVPSDKISGQITEIVEFD